MSDSRGEGLSLIWLPFTSGGGCKSRLSPVLPSYQLTYRWEVSTTHLEYQHQLQVQVVISTFDWLVINQRFPWFPPWVQLMGSINLFAGVAHRTQGTCLLTRVSVHYKEYQRIQGIARWRGALRKGMLVGVQSFPAVPGCTTLQHLDVSTNWKTFQTPPFSSLFWRLHYADMIKTIIDHW